ncbi:MAG: hypothetical protein R3362_12765, partial [Rhodothermales bacterium]|nr:hypothetical protein [Rhodothermales bacterium]
SRPGALVFNQIVALRDTWGRQQQESQPAAAKPKKKPAPQPPPPPRDPAATLTDRERERYQDLVARGVGEEEAAVLAADADLDALFDAVTAAHDAPRDAPRDAAVLLVHDVRQALDGRPASASKATPEALAAVLRMVDEKTLTSTGASEAVAALVEEGGTAEAVVEARGLAAVRDEAALAPYVDDVLEAHPEEAGRYRAGETRLLGFFIGQVMRHAGKGADPKRVQDLLRERLARQPEADA